MRPPPNSAELFRIRRAGRIPSPGPYGHVSVLPDWNLTVAGAYVYAPPEIEPRELDFSFVAGLDVALFIHERCPFHRVYQTPEFLFDGDHLDLLAAIMAGNPETITVIELNRVHLGLGPAVLAVFGRGHHA